MTRLHLFGVIASLILLTGCPNDPKARVDVTEDVADPKAESPPVAVAEAVHDVSCGCVIPDVKKCSEWVKVDGAFIPLTNHGLKGAMPFCGKVDLKAKVTGEVKDGELVASEVEVLQ